jgi:hypothetical protein
MNAIDVNAIDMRRINDTLQAEDDRLTASLSSPSQPVSFIVALPRGASTMFQQIVISAIDMGYITNLMAQFWLAPCIGAGLDRKLRPDQYTSSFASRFGNTVGAHEPHEWGWFWRHWLRLEGDEHYCGTNRVLDGNGLRKKLAGLEQVLDAPLLFDNVYAMANFGTITKLLPSVIAVHLTRDPYFICNSILNARMERYGSLHHFYGHRPRNVDTLISIEDPIEQVVLQVKSLVAEVEETLSTHPDSHIFTADYTTIVEDPLGTVDRFAAFLEGHGIGIRRKAHRPDIRLNNRNNLDHIPLDRRTAVDPVFARQFGDDALPRL